MINGIVLKMSEYEALVLVGSKIISAGISLKASQGLKAKNAIVK